MGSFRKVADLGHAVESGVEGTGSFSSVVTRNHAQIIVEIWQESCQSVYHPRVHVDMQITDLKDSEPVKRCRNGRSNEIVFHPNVSGVSGTAPIQPGKSQKCLDGNVRNPKAKEAYSVSTYIVHVSFKLDTLLGALAPETAF
jgi:hypothetical protein